MVKFAGLHLRGITKVEIIRDSKFDTVDIAFYGEKPWNCEKVVAWGIYDVKSDKYNPIEITVNETQQVENEKAA